MPTRVIQWRAEDGRLFDTELAALRHEQALALVNDLADLPDSHPLLPVAWLLDAFKQLQAKGWTLAPAPRPPAPAPAPARPEPPFGGC